MGSQDSLLLRSTITSSATLFPDKVIVCQKWKHIVLEQKEHGTVPPTPSLQLSSTEQNSKESVPRVFLSRGSGILFLFLKYSCKTIQHEESRLNRWVYILLTSLSRGD